MRRFVSVLVIAVMLFTLAGPAAASSSSSDAQRLPWDVVGTAWEASVRSLSQVGLLTGFPDGSFQPQAQLTRAQVAAIAVRVLGLEGATAVSVPFTDVPPTHWAYHNIGVAAREGLVQGADGRFRPDDLVTQAELVTILLRLAGQDTNLVGDWPVAQVMRARELGLLAGLDFQLSNPARRGDMAVMLNRTVHDIVNPRTGRTLSQGMVRAVVGIEVVAPGGFLVAGDNVLEVRAVDAGGRPVQTDVTLERVAGAAVVRDGFRVEVDTTATAITLLARVGTITKEVTLPVVTSLRVTPDTAVLAVGQELALAAQGVTAAGATVPATPRWTLLAGQGQVSDNGVLTVTSSGVVQVQARVGSVVRTASFTVVDSLSIQPATAVRRPGEQQQFTAVADTPAGSVAVQGIWSVSGNGTITADGLYTAGTRAETVTFRLGHLTADAPVKVLSQITVTPQLTNLAQGQTVQFTAVATDGTGAPVPIEPVWSVSPVGVGILDQKGTFFASGSGEATVTAAVGEVSGAAAVTTAGTPTQLKVQTSASHMVANGKSTMTVTAEVLDAQGRLVPVTGHQVVFGLTVGTLGTLQPTMTTTENGVATTTLTSSLTATTGQIIASSGEGTLTSSMVSITTIAPQVSRIRLTAYPNPLAADGSGLSTITATLLDADGQTMTNNTGSSINVTLSADSNAAGTLQQSIISIPTGQSTGTAAFRAGTQVGASLVSGMSVYTVDPVVMQSVVVGPAQRLNLRVVSDAKTANGTDKVEVRAEVVDANGNVRTDQAGLPVQIQVLSGSATPEASVVATQFGVATFYLTSTTSGQVKLRVLPTSGGLRSADATVSFVAGPATGISLSVDPIAVLAADGVSTVDLVARVVDAQGNTVLTATNTISFTKTQNQYVTLMPGQTSVTAANGEARLTLQAATNVGTDRFQATAQNLAGSNLVDVQAQIIGGPHSVRVQPLTNTTVGSPVRVDVHVLDYVNRVVTGDNGRTIHLNLSSPTATVQKVGVTRSGVATFEITDTKAGIVTVTANVPGLLPDNVGRAVTFAAGPPDRILLSPANTALSADGVSQTQITAWVVDAYDNVLPQSLQVGLTSSNTVVGTLSSANVWTGQHVTFTSSNTAGSTTLSAPQAVYPVMPVTLTTYKAGPPARVEVVVPSTTVAGTQIPLAVRITDAAGNPVTNLHTGTNLTAAGLRVTGATGTTTVSASDATGLLPFGFAANGVSAGAARITSGQATITFSSTKAETVTLEPVVYYQNERLIPVTTALTVQPGVPVQLNSSSNQISLSRAQAQQTTVRFFLVDAFGNQVTTAQQNIEISTGTHALIELPGETHKAMTSGEATFTIASRVHSVGGTASVTAVASPSGLTRVVQVITDIPPEAPHLSATNQGGTSTTVGLADTAARVVITVSPRHTTQTVTLMVNGVAVPMYTTPGGSNAVNSISAGLTSLTAYVNRADLGPAGSKQLRAVVTTPMGVSPVSNQSNLTVQ